MQNKEIIRKKLPAHPLISQSAEVMIMIIHLFGSNVGESFDRREILHYLDKNDTNVTFYIIKSIMEKMRKKNIITYDKKTKGFTLTVEYIHKDISIYDVLKMHYEGAIELIKDYHMYPATDEEVEKEDLSNLKQHLIKIHNEFMGRLMKTIIYKGRSYGNNDVDNN